MGSGAWRSLPRWRRVSRTASCARPGPRWWQAGRPPPAGSRDRPASRREHAGAPRRWTGPCRGPSGRSRLRAVAQWSVLPMPGADEDLDVLDIHLSCRLSVKSIRGQPVDDRFRTHACERPLPFCGGSFPLSAVTSARLPQVTFAPDHLRTGARHHAHSSWPSPQRLPPGATNKVTGTLFGAGLLSTFFAVVAGFAIHPEDLRRGATPELLDDIAANVMALRLGDE